MPRQLVATLDARQLEFVLRHEFTHIARRDHWVRFVELSAAMIYWWHPALWVTRVALGRWADRCCDAEVLRHETSAAARCYAETLVQIAESATRAPFLATAMAAKSPLRRRIEMFSRNRLPNRLHAITYFLLLPFALLILACAPQSSTSDAATPSALDSQESDTFDATDFIDTETTQQSITSPNETPTASALESPTPPPRLRPGSEIRVVVSGTLPDEPIDAIYEVDGAGSIFFGPHYGSVVVDRLTAVEAATAITKHLATKLRNPVVGVSLVLGSRERNTVQVPPHPYTIGPGDLLEIRVSGTLPDAPINDNFLVEPSGKVSLGPRYGRVVVAGLSLEDAEANVRQHLETILRQPMVSLTIGGWRHLIPGEGPRPVVGQKLRPYLDLLRDKGTVP